MDDQNKIKEILEDCANLVPLLKTVGIPHVYTIRRAQYLLDWINAGNEDKRKRLGIEVGGAFFNETIELEDKATKESIQQSNDQKAHL